MGRSGQWKAEAPCRRLVDASNGPTPALFAAGAFVLLALTLFDSTLAQVQPTGNQGEPPF